MTTIELTKLEALCKALEQDFVGDACKNEPDDEPVGGGLNTDGSQKPMALTFGMIRNLRNILNMA